MAVVAVCSHRVRGAGKSPNIAAECFCGWRMGSLTGQGFQDAGHLHYALEGDTPIVYVFPPSDTDREGSDEDWPVVNLESVVYSNG